MISIRQRGALRGVRFIAYDSVVAYAARSERDRQPVKLAGNAATPRPEPAEHVQFYFSLETDRSFGKP